MDMILFGLIFRITTAYFRGRFEENILQGDYVLKTKASYVIPFTARFGQDYRFSQLRKEPALDVSGEWEVTFEVERKVVRSLQGDW